MDIGEVDLIVCYDSSSSPIRMLQRMGRTGRKRAGNIVLLLMKGKEEDSYTKAKDNYEKMQQMIANGSRFTFHDERSPRIIPKEISPVADKRQVDIPVENSQVDLPEPRKRSKATKRAPKKFHMPDGVQTGFVQASSINGKSTSAKRKIVHDPEVAPLPTLDTVLLSSKEEMELDQRYCNVGGVTPQYVQRPRFDAFPEWQRKARPTGKVSHSRLTRQLVKCLDTMQHSFDYPTSNVTLADYAKTLAMPPRARKEAGINRHSTARSINARSSSGTRAADEALPEVRESSAGSSPRSQGYHRWSRSEISPKPSNDQQRSERCEDRLFYVSQRSDGDEDDSDDELPNVDSLVSGETHQCPLTHMADEISPAKALNRRRWKRQRVLQESDDE